MGLFTRLEKIDGALNRGYARWGRWVWGSLLAAILAYAGWTVWAAVWGPPTGPVTLIIHSEIDRPIRGFSVNGVAGSNAYANGGGGATCCGSISGDTAEVIWTVDYTLAQYNAGVRTEIHKVVMPLPLRQWGENYLHTYFLVDGSVRLWWGTGFIHPEVEDLPRPQINNPEKG
jgi:hypothetical protein